MAVVMMGGDEKNPIFHDFLGMSCGDTTIPDRGCEGEVEAEAASVGVSSAGHGIVSGSSDLGSERQGVNSSEIFHLHGRKNAISGPEASNTFSVRKRSNSSAFTGLIRDRMLPVGSDSIETSRLMKMFGKEVVSERLGRSHDDEIPFSVQPPPRPTSSLILHPPVSTRPDSLISKWEQSLPMNPGSVAHCPSRFGQSGIHMDKVSSSYTYKGANVGATLLSQAAADEGSRTGMKGSGILNIINPSSSGAGERSAAGVLPYSNRPKAPQIVELESSNAPSRHNMAPSSRQMTIFYAGQAHVFDDVHPNKADVIMALAGSNGGSWSTTYSPKPGVHPPVGEAEAPSGENEMRTNNFPVPIQGIPDPGLISQVARIPFTSDLPSLTPGSRAVRDARLTTPAAEPDTEGKRDV